MPIVEMDDPLRPTTVPLSAETILWFEFLLDPTLLTVHLAKENATPTPIELITKFLSIAPENQTNTIDITTPDIESAMNRNEGLKIGRKQLALKILGLKVASHLKWNLQVLERNLTLQKQVQLLSDLCSVTSGKLVNLPLSLVHECQLGPEGSKQAFNFALTLYHRWVLRTQVLKEIPSRVFKQGFNHILTTQDQATSFRDEMFLSSLEPFTQTSIDFLTQICQDEDSFIHLTYDSFVALSPNMPPDRLEQDFENSIKISKAELKAQIFFDLCLFYLYDKKYELAREKAAECRDNLAIVKEEYADKMENGETADEHTFLFCTFSDDELNGCLMACGLHGTANVGLLYRMNESIIQNYKDITNIFEEDNVKLEVPLVNRRILELDLEGEQAQCIQKTSKEVMVQVAALNTVRSIIDNEDLFSPNDFLYKYQKQNGFSILLEAAISFLQQSSRSEHKDKIKEAFRNMLLTAVEDINATDMDAMEKNDLFTCNDLAEIKRVKQSYYTSMPVDNMAMSPLCTMSDWKMSDSKVSSLELAALKRQLINCTTSNAVRVLLVKCTNLIISCNPPQSMEPWNISPRWIMPIQIKSVLMSMQRGFLQDFAYILVAKAKDLAAKNEFKLAINLLNAAKVETQRHESNSSITKLNKLIDYEILLFQITQQLSEWPKRLLENSIMVSKCKQCLIASQNGDTVVPRVEILDACAAMLLNLNESSELVGTDKRYPSSDLYSAIANATTELELNKSNTMKKVCRDAWDLVLPMFSSNNSQSLSTNNKRSQSGGTNAGASGTNSGSVGGSLGNSGVTSSSGNNNNGSGTPNLRDSPTVIVSTNLLPFLNKLRDPLPISIMLSLLTRLHNILDDNSNRELNTEYMHLWPTSISNASGYSTDVVTETLKNLLKQALHFYPQYVPWIRLEGDLELRNENYESAMTSYVNAIITGSEYCTVNIQRQIDDYIIRRMIKCSSNLGCYMQAAILCQFLEEMDYSLAFKTFLDRSTFKTISDKSTFFSDAMDSYFNCIWDPTLLEFIVNLESKKGEHKRKQQAIAVLGQLELNANNNEEVKREAASIRRIKFLQALAKQYLL